MHAARGRGRLASKTHNCGKGTTSVADNFDAVQCSKFVNWFHLACSDVKKEVYSPSRKNQAMPIYLYIIYIWHCVTAKNALSFVQRQTLKLGRF